MAIDYFKKIMTPLVLAILVVISFFLLRPILMAIIVGIILAFVFNPIYVWLLKKLKYKNLSAGLICTVLIIAIILPLWFLTPILINQSIKVFLASQQVDFVTPLKNIFPSLFSSDEFSAQIGPILSSSAVKFTNYLANSISKVIFNFPTLALQSIVVFFTFFFVLRDKEKIVDYIQSLMPFSKDVEKKLFESSRDITSAVIYGQVVIGIIQGIIAGIGFFIFGVPNALLLTLLASLAGIFPIIGTGILWFPVLIYLLIAGNTVQALGVGTFGVFSSTIDNIIRPIFVSQRTNLHPLMIIIGMIGGLFLFGILGFILGPLILAYVFIILEIYRNKKGPSILRADFSSR